VSSFVAMLFGWAVRIGLPSRPKRLFQLPKTQLSVGLPFKGSVQISKFHIRNRSRPPFALAWVVPPTKIPIMARVGWRAGEC